MSKKTQFDIEGALTPVKQSPIDVYNPPKGKKVKGAAPKAARPESATIKAAKQLKETHYTQDQAQAALGLCYNTFKKLLDAGEFQRQRHGRHYWIKKADVEAYLTRNFGG